MRLLTDYSVCYVIIFFFFQAEDGIRDVAVTGVQTCALPIYAHHGSRLAPWAMTACALDSEGVSPRRQSCICRYPSIAIHFVPLVIQSFQFVTIAACRSVQVAQRRKFD